jgi:trk system potassium uptake protein TrkA
LMHGIDKVDVAVVGIGNDFESSALATVLLKQIGVPRVISRAITPTSARILARIGADEVVNPEDEAADRWCSRMISPEFLSQHQVGDGHSLVEIKAPDKWVGKTLTQLNLRARFGVLVVAIKIRRTTAGAPDRMVVELPDPGLPLEKDQVLVLFGLEENLAQLPRDSPIQTCRGYSELISFSFPQVYPSWLKKWSTAQWFTRTCCVACAHFHRSEKSGLMQCARVRRRCDTASRCASCFASASACFQSGRR